MSMPELMAAYSAKDSSLADLHGTACTIAESSFHEFGGTPPFFLVQSQNGIMAFTTPWADDKEKQASIIFMICVIQSTDATAYAFASETYSTMIERGGGESVEDFDARTAAMVERGLDELPSEHRDEVLMIFTQNKHKSSRLMARYLINSKRRGRKPFLGPRIDDLEAAQVDGRMIELFDAPAARGPAAVVCGAMLLRMISKLERE